MGALKPLVWRLEIICVVPETYRYPYAGPIKSWSSNFRPSQLVHRLGDGAEHLIKNESNHVIGRGQGRDPIKSKGLRDISSMEPVAFDDANN